MRIQGGRVHARLQFQFTEVIWASTPRATASKAPRHKLCYSACFSLSSTKRAAFLSAGCCRRAGSMSRTAAASNCSGPLPPLCCCLARFHCACVCLPSGQLMLLFCSAVSPFHWAARVKKWHLSPKRHLLSAAPPPAARAAARGMLPPTCKRRRAESKSSLVWYPFRQQWLCFCASVKCAHWSALVK
jgi:hypothetical protein